MLGGEFGLSGNPDSILGDGGWGKVKMLGVAARLSVNSEESGRYREKRGSGEEPGRKEKKGRRAGDGEMAASQKDFHLLTKPMRPATRETRVRKPPHERPLGGSGGREHCPGDAIPRPLPRLGGGALRGPSASAVQASCSTLSLTPDSWRHLIQSPKCVVLISTSG